MLFQPCHTSDRLFSLYKDIYAMTADDMGNPPNTPFNIQLFSIKKTTNILINNTIKLHSVKQVIYTAWHTNQTPFNIKTASVIKS